MIVAPPSETGAVHARATSATPWVAVRLVGAPAVVVAVATLALSDVVPVPAAFTADTLNVYVVECDKPVTVVDAVVEVPSVNVAHVVPLSDEYSIV